jgi:hypothetical protein
MNNGGTEVKRSLWQGDHIGGVHLQQKSIFGTFQRRSYWQGDHFEGVFTKRGFTVVRYNVIPYCTE